MNSIFYNIVSILVGLFVFGFGVMKAKKQPLSVIILIFIHAIGFIGFGVYGFFIPEKYEYITILAMLAFAITLALTIFTLYDKKADNKPKGKNN